MSKSTTAVDAPETTVKMPTIPVNQVARMSEKECIAAGLSSTSKAKPRLGIRDEHEVVWCPANFSLDDHQNLMCFAKGRNMTAFDLLASAAMQWFEDNREAIYTEADVAYKAAETAEDVVKRIAALNRQLAKAQEMLAKHQPAADDGPAE